MNISGFSINNRIKFINVFTKGDRVGNIVNSVENKITMKEKSKNYIDTSVFEQKLNQVVSEKLQESAEIKAKQRHVTGLLTQIRNYYTPIENKINNLLKQADIYEKYRSELEKGDISDAEKDKIKLKMSKIEKDIKYKMSPDMNLLANKYISEKIDPKIVDLTKQLSNEIDRDLNINTFTLNSMEDLGLSYNKDDDMDTIIAKIKNASSNMEGKISQLDELENEYGVSSRNHTLLKLKKKDKESSKISKSDADKILELAKKLGIKFDEKDDLSTIVGKINDFMKNKVDSKNNNNKKIDIYV